MHNAHVRWWLVGWLLALMQVGCGLGAEAKHNYERWEKEISAFAAADRTNPPPQKAWLFIGSSTVRLWKSLARDFPEHQVINRGFGGSEIMDATYFAERIVFPYQPSRIFLRAGGNDLNAGKSPEEVFGNFKAFVAKIRTRLPDTDIVYLSLSPSIARWGQAEREKTLNGLVEAYARQAPHVKYLEAYSVSLGPEGKPQPELFLADKLHFNQAGYQRLAERVRAWLAKEP